MTDTKGLIDISADEYQAKASLTAVYPAEVAVEYLSLGVCSEAGELAGKVKKYLRGDGELTREALVGELGDVLWYVAMLSRELGMPLSRVMRENLKKLENRAERGKIRGDGDHR